MVDPKIQRLLHKKGGAASVLAVVGSLRLMFSSYIIGSGQNESHHCTASILYAHLIVTPAVGKTCILGGIPLI